NAAVENESHGGATNDTPPTAQSLEPAFVQLHRSGAADPNGAQPAPPAVLGPHDQFVATTIYSADFASGSPGFTVDNTPPNGSYRPGQWHLSEGRGAQPGHTATHSFYYGHGEGPDGGGTFSYGVFSPTRGSLISPSIALPTGGALELDFNYVL